MNNLNFSSLIYKIIGEPERWHDDYVDVMNQVIDETARFEDAENLSELEIGEKLVARLRLHNDTLSAFSTLLDRSRFKLIILNESFKPIYHNLAAQDLFTELLSSDKQDQLNNDLLSILESYPLIDEADVLHSLDLTDSNGDQIYLRTIIGETAVAGQTVSFHLLLVLDRNLAQKDLNHDLISKFELSRKEQRVLRHLMHGQSIKEISAELFVSENTVKSHLKSIYRKTSTNSQSDVIRLMLTHESRILDPYFNTSANFASSNTLSAELDKCAELDDGTKLVYRDYGPADGRPLVMYHGGFGSRLSVPKNCHAILARHNRRLIIMDRPGFGKSPAVAEHPNGWNQRMNNFIDILGLGQYDLLGTILGSQMAFSFAQTADQRLGKVILAGPVLLNSDDHIQYLKGVLSPSARLAKVSKRVSIEIHELWLKSVTLNLSSHYRKMLESTIGSAERKLFEPENTLDILISSFQEGSSASLIGMSHEYRHCMGPLKIDLNNFKNEVVLWHGTEDNRYATEGAQAIADELPNCTLHVCEGFSEHIYYSKFEEIVA